MKRKSSLILVVLFVASIVVAFTAGYKICYAKLSYNTHTKTYLDANRRIIHEINYKSRIDAILREEIKHGVEATYDENGKIIESGEWKDGKPWNGRCWIPDAGDAGSWAGLGKYKTFKNGVQLD